MIISVVHRIMFNLNVHAWLKREMTKNVATRHAFFSGMNLIEYKVKNPDLEQPGLILTESGYP